MKHHGLTARQLEVAVLKAAGYRNKAIAADLAISVRAVQRHVESIVNALGLSREKDAAVQIAQHLTVE